MGKKFSSKITKSNASKLHASTHAALMAAFPMNKIIQEFNVKVEDERGRMHNLYLDFFISDLSIGVECQGKQHFEPNSHFFGPGGFEKAKNNDKLKKEWCSMNGIMLVEITYKEDPTPELILEKIQEVM